MKNIIKKQSGITLIALVITIVVLIILAGVAINLTLSQNGIFNKATQAREKYSAAEAKERLEQEILNIQIEAVKEGKEFSLKYLNEKLDKTKYEIILDAEENPTIEVIKEINSNFYLTVDSELNIIKVEEKEPKPQYIKFGEVTWENGKASITLTTKENGTIEYKVGENGVYVAGTTISNLNNGDMVYARINNNGTFTDEQTIKIEDKIQPEEFKIEISNITSESVQLSGSTTDNQTGIKDYTYVVATGDTIVKEIKNQTITEYTIDGLESATEYIVYMLAYDNAGNVRKSNEKIVTTEVRKYKWQKYSVNSNTEIKFADEYKDEVKISSYYIYSMSGISYNNIYAIDKDKCCWIRPYATKIRKNIYEIYLPDIEGKWLAESETPNIIYHGDYALEGNRGTNTWKIVIKNAQIRQVIKNIIYSKGTINYGDIFSELENEYPKNGYQDGYWYVFVK